jgi:hypothetical protein
LPLVFGDQSIRKRRLTYRFLDLRERIHKNILLRSNVISSLRRRMIGEGSRSRRRSDGVVTRRCAHLRRAIIRAVHALPQAAAVQAADVGLTATSRSRRASAMGTRGSFAGRVLSARLE